MKTTRKNISETTVQLTITVGSSELKDAEQVALVKLAEEIKVPGFRAGKAPISVAAKHVNPNVLMEQTLDNALNRAVAEAFLAEQLQALDRPSVEVKKYVPGEALEFTAEVEVLPEVDHAVEVAVAVVGVLDQRITRGERLAAERRGGRIHRQILRAGQQAERGV